MTRTTKDLPYRLRHPRTEYSGAEVIRERVELAFDSLELDYRECSFRQVLKAICDRSRLPWPEDEELAVRSVGSSIEGAAALAGIVNTEIIRGFESVKDTTEGWTHRAELPNFLQAYIGSVSEAPRLTRLPRGDTSAHVSLAISRQGFSLFRYGIQFAIDAQDLMDGETIGGQLLPITEAGRSAARLPMDLVYSAILENPTQDSDSLAAFEAATHGNLGTGALAGASLDSAIAAIENRTLDDQDGAPAHLGMDARFLIVPGELKRTAKALARSMQTGDDSDLVVRTESRISSEGVFDAGAETVRTGSATNWLLAAPSSQRPGVVLAARDGKFEPQLVSYELSDGEWGIGFNVSLDIAVCLSDYRPLYWSTGAA